MKRVLLLAVGVVVSCACAPETRSSSRDQQAAAEGSGVSEAREGPCQISNSTTLTGQGIGALVIGLTVAEVRNICHVIRDTVELDEEAQEERQLTVDLQRDTVVAAVADDTVWRIEVHRGAFRTVDSLGVGSSLRGLLRSPGGHGAEGDAGLFVLLPSHCGLSFHLGYDVKDEEHRGDWALSDLSRLPDTTLVDYVLVVGCQR